MTVIDNVTEYLAALADDLTPEQALVEWTVVRLDLAALYEQDRATFAVAARLVQAKLGVSRKDLEADLRSLREPRATRATALVNLARDIEFFHTPERDAWATIQVDDHHEHWQLRSSTFRRFLIRRFYEAEHKAPGTQALQDAIGALEAKALFDGAEQSVFTRIAEYEGKIFIDLANDSWEAVKITPTGWRVIHNPPVRFRRTKSTLALPRPIPGGSVEVLRPFVNIRHEDWPLLLAWLLMVFSPRGPYPVLSLNGEQGSTKSTTARVLRSLSDPVLAPLRTAPREERDLMISANTSWVLAFDNLSVLPQWLSDALCRLATGGGLSTRTLYTDADETLFDAQRPILVTAIEDIVVNGDLADRSIRLLLPQVEKKNRKVEKVFWRQFEQAHPYILGALLDIVASILDRLPHVLLAEPPRMADFALWITAAEPALGWKAGTFMRAYNANRASANEIVLDASPLATAVKALLARGEWQGTATELLEQLGSLLPDKETKARSWPKDPLSLSNHLRRLAPSLRSIGIEAVFFKEANSGARRLIRIRQESSVASDASVADRDGQGQNSDVPQCAGDAAGDASPSSDAVSDVPHEYLGDGTHD